MIEVGRICIKLAGRDAGGECVIVDVLDDNYVLIDGNVRRRKCNIAHLEPTEKKAKIKKNASHEEVKKEFESLKLTVWETKPKESKEKPKKVQKKKAVPEGKKGSKKDKKAAKSKEKKKDKTAKASEKKK